MNSMARTYVGQIELKARKEGREEGYREAYHKAYHEAYHEARDEAKQSAYEKEVKTVLNMINRNCDDEFIQDVTKLPLEEIAKIREQHT